MWTDKQTKTTRQADRQTTPDKQDKPTKRQPTQQDHKDTDEQTNETTKPTDRQPTKQEHTDKDRQTTNEQTTKKLTNRRTNTDRQDRRTNRPTKQDKTDKQNNQTAAGNCCVSHTQKKTLNTKYLESTQETPLCSLRCQHRSAKKVSIAPSVPATPGEHYNVPEVFSTISSCIEFCRSHKTSGHGQVFANITRNVSRVNSHEAIQLKQKTYYIMTPARKGLSSEQS